MVWIMLDYMMWKQKLVHLILHCEKNKPRKLWEPGEECTYPFFSAPVCDNIGHDVKTANACLKNY